jgi:hypothetical protein
MYDSTMSLNRQTWPIIVLYLIYLQHIEFVIGHFYFHLNSASIIRLWISSDSFSGAGMKAPEPCPFPRGRIGPRKLVLIFIHIRAAKNAIFCVLSRNILDTKGPDPRFHQYLQGFRVFKKVVIMTCTKSVLCAIIEIKIMNEDPEDLLPAELRRKTQTEVLSQSLRESASSAGHSPVLISSLFLSQFKAV